ncbi:MAG: hypothetical protein ACPL5F_09450 [Moorellaceae bacterium]
MYAPPEWRVFRDLRLPSNDVPAKAHTLSWSEVLGFIAVPVDFFAALRPLLPLSGLDPAR